MKLFKRKVRIHQIRMKQELSDVINAQIQNLDITLTKLANSIYSKNPSINQALRSTEPESIATLLRFTYNAFLYYEIEERYGYRAAGQITVQPLMASLILISNGRENFIDKAIAYNNAKLSDTYINKARYDRKNYKSIDSPIIRRLLLEELQKKFSESDEVDLTPFIEEICHIFLPVIEYLDTNLLDNVKGKK